MSGRSQYCLAVLILMLGGCSTVSVTQVPSTQPMTAPPVSAPSTAPVSAVAALVSAAHAHAAAGQPEQAAAALERALRIEPRDAMLWHRLAKLRLTQGHWEQAAAVAAKSNSLARGDERLQADNWAVIAQARDNLGDHAGAREARIRAAGLRPQIQ